MYKLQLSGLLAFWVAFGVTQANSSSALEHEIKPASSASLSSLSQPVKGLQTVPYELTYLSDLPNRLKEILTAHNLNDCRLMVYFDFDDVLAQQEYTIPLSNGTTYPFRYLSSAENSRMLGPVVRSIIQEKGAGDAIKQTASSAIFSLHEGLFKSGILSYRYPESIPFQVTHQALRKMGATVKICSGLLLDSDGPKLDFVKAIGLSAADYIYASNKSQGIAQYIAFDYAAQQSSGATVNPNYVAVLLDNCRGSNCGTSSIDNFVSGMNAQKVPEGVKVVPIAVYSNRFMTEVERDKKIICAEIDAALSFTAQLQRQQIAALLEQQKQNEQLMAVAALKPADHPEASQKSNQDGLA